MAEIEILPDSETLAMRAAELFISTAAESIAARGRFTVALSGGSTPERMYLVLAAPDKASQVDWSRVIVLPGDERLVPETDPRSNMGMARRTLLDHVPIPPENILHVLADTGASAEDAFQQAVAERLGSDELPALDLIYLGLGSDGHTASLFPGAPALDVTDRWVVRTPPGTLPPPVDRVTFTYPVINNARRVVFLAAGSDKAEIAHEVLEGEVTQATHPAAGIKPVSGELTWLLDIAAAAKLAPRTA